MRAIPIVTQTICLYGYLEDMYAVFIVRFVTLNR